MVVIYGDDCDDGSDDAGDHGNVWMDQQMEKTKKETSYWTDSRNKKFANKSRLAGKYLCLRELH